MTTSRALGGAGPFADICEFFFEQEARLELLDDLPGGLPLWPTMRVKAAQWLAARLGEAQAPHVAPPVTASLLARVTRRATHLTALNPFEVTTPCDVVVLEHTRTVERDGRRVDPYSLEWERGFQERGLDYRALSAPYALGRDKDFVPPRYSTQAILDLGWLEPLTRFDTLPSAFLRKMREFDDDAQRRFGRRLRADVLALRRYQALSGRSSLYTRLLELWQPKRAYLIEGYGLNVAFLAAAARVGIPTTEIQHGTFSRYHLGYSYPGRSRPLAGFADELVVWSDEWRARVPFSESMSRVSVHEPEWLTERRVRLAGTSKEKTVLVISQGILGDRVAQSFLESIEQFAGWKKIYKLHPGELARSADYPHLKRLVQEHGVELAGDTELGSLLARADSVVGVYSTALYEALDLGCRVFLLPLPGLEQVAHLLDEGRAELLVPGGSPFQFSARRL